MRVDLQAKHGVDGRRRHGGVQGAQHQVAAVRRPHRRLRRLGIAGFADIEALRRKIRALQKEEAAELEKSLTASQKARLKELQARGPGEFKLNGPRQEF